MYIQYIYPVVSFHSSSPKNPHRLIIFYPKTKYFDSSVNALHPPSHPIRKTPVLFNLFETGSISQFIDDVAFYDTSSPFKQWPMPNQILNLFEYTSRTSRTERNSKALDHSVQCLMYPSTTYKFVPAAIRLGTISVI